MVRALALVLTTSVAAVACSTATPQDRARVSERDQLRREVAGLRRLADTSLFALAHPEQDVLVSVSDSLVHGLLGASLPVSVSLAGSVHVTLTRAVVTLRSNVAQVEVLGTVERARTPRVAATVTMRGALDAFGIDSAHVLRGRLHIDDVNVDSATQLPAPLRRPARNILQGLLERSLPEISEQLPALAIPVRLERRVQLPGFGPSGYIRLPAASAPLAIEVAQVLALRDRLWIVLHLDRGAFVAGSGARDTARTDAAGRGSP